MACVGQGVPLVSIPTWLTNLEYDWQNPGRAPLWRFLADRFRLIRYDGRGFGLSDREVTEISLSTFGRDSGQSSQGDLTYLVRSKLGKPKGAGRAV